MDIFDKCYNFKEAQQVQERGLYPYFRPIGEIRGSRVKINGQELIMIGSNNYLGLSHDPRVKEAAKEAIDKFGTSCSGSRFLNGTLSLHEELEHRLAEFVGKESALVYSTGYQSNLGAISVLLGKGDHIFTDRFNHASIMDGIFFANGVTGGAIKVHRYLHNSMPSLEKRLKEIPHDEPKIIVTDGVFSMEGDIVELPEMKRIAAEHNARIYIDEAHAVGVIGKHGKGTEEHCGISGQADIIMCTFSKSFGSLGGFLAGDFLVIDYIKHLSRPLMFSASMPPGALAAVLKALDIIENELEHVTRLQEITRRMIRGFKDIGFDVGETETPIIPLMIRDFDRTMLFWKGLFENGVYANPVVSPAVPPDRSLIRTSFMAIHTDEDLERVLEIAEKEGKKLGII